jgi:hypothetical protein
MMTTFASLLPAYLDLHSWLMHTPGLSQLADWPAIPFTGGREGRRSLLVQYALQDRLFPVVGMRDADAVLAAGAGPGFEYTASWNEGAHAMTRPMQAEVADFFAGTLAGVAA